MAIDVITASADRSLTTLPSRHEDMNGSSMIGSCSAAASLTAFAVASRVATVPASSRATRTSSFAKSSPASLIACAEYAV